MSARPPELVVMATTGNIIKKVIKKTSSKERGVETVDNLKDFLINDPEIFTKLFVLEGGARFLLFGKRTEKDRFVILTMEDFFSLTNEMIKDEISANDDH